MGLSHSFKVARKKCRLLNDDEKNAALAICRDIHQAQRALKRKAAPILANCMIKCKGLCCKNIRPDDIITQWDLVFILLLSPHLEPEIASCVEKEGFFPEDCIFLKNGTGPCLFPDNQRPERCVISFCRLEPTVEKEISHVMGGFSRLIRYFMMRPYGRVWRLLFPS